MTSSMPIPEPTEAASPEAPGAPPPAKRRWRRSALQVGLIAIVAGAIAWGLSQYLDPPPRNALASIPDEAFSATIDGTPEDLQRIGRYGNKNQVSMATLTPEVMQVLESLSASLGDLPAEIEATEARLRAADPHLDRALEDPLGVPLRSDTPVLSRDVYKGFLPTLEVMLKDFASSATPAERKLVEPLRRCMTATLLKQPVPADELAQLEAAWEAGSDAPLLLLCLFRSYGSDDRQGGWIWQAHEVKQQRAVCPETAALISTNLILYRDQLSAAQLALVTESFIHDTVNLWTALSAADAPFAVRDFYVSYTYNGMTRINANGKVDLLLALARQSDPPIFPAIMHLAANVLLRDGARNHRGSDFISETPPEELSKFMQLAQMQTQHLLKAWTLEPGYRLLPTLLMEVEMKAGSTPGTVDHWFRHSLAARCEYSFNFDIYESSARARWGGSPEKQIWLAQKYVETGDLDSGIPVRISVPLWSVCQDQGRSQRLGKHPQILKIASDFVQLLKAHSKDTPHPSVVPGVATIVAMTLWDGGEYADLDWFFEVYHEAISCDQYHENRLHGSQMCQMTKAILADPSLRWETVRRHLFGDSREVTLADLDQTDQAIRQLRQQDDGTNSDRTKLLDHCQNAAATLRRLLSHQQVVMSDADLQSWLVVDESMSASFPRLPAEGDADEPAPPITGIDEKTGVVDLRIWIPGQKGLLMCPFQIDPPLSFSMDVEELQPGDDPYGISLLVGPALNVADLTGYVGPMLTLNSSHNQVIRGHLPRVEWKQNVSGYQYGRSQSKYTIKIEAYPDGYRTYFGDKQLETVRTPLHTGGLLQLGRYISFFYNDMPQEYVKYRVSNVRLQKLKQNSVDATEESLDPSTI